jgi:ABC-type multidrug transport system permease subunit
VAGLGVLATMVLAALGGAWWPIEVTPGWMQSLAMFLPTGWTMDAMHRLVSFGRASVSVIPHVTALVVGACIIGWPCARTFRYQ